MIRLSDQDVSNLVTNDCPLNRARREFAAAASRIEQMSSQRGFSPLTARRMEVEGIYKIVEALGLSMPDEETLLATRQSTSRTPDQAAGQNIPEIGSEPQQEQPEGQG
jgi:hypothetical protein